MPSRHSSPHSPHPSHGHPYRRSVLIVLAALVLALLAAGLSPRSASSQEPPIRGDVPAEGTGLLAPTEDLTVDQLVAALGSAGCTARTIAVTRDGAWILYVVGAPAFVNAAFPATIAADQPFSVRCGGNVDGGGFVLTDAQGEGSGGFAQQTGVDASTEAGYDRLVIEFDADVIPSYDIEYATGPLYTCGAGAPVNVAGEAALRVRLDGARINDDAGALTIPSRTLSPDLARIKELREICAFEGQVTWIVALDRATTFRLDLRQAPGRLVLDFRHVDCEECDHPGGRGGIAGVVFAGPQCPLLPEGPMPPERPAPSEGAACPDRLADVPLEFAVGDTVIATAQTGADAFVVYLPAGTYDVRLAASAQAMLALAPATVTVVDGVHEWVELRVDTGIR